MNPLQETTLTQILSAVIAIKHLRFSKVKKKIIKNKPSKEN